MPKWQLVELGNQLRLTSGFPFASAAFSSEEGTPLIRIRDLLDSNVETYFQGAYLPTYLVQPGDVLIGMDGDFNVVRWKGGVGLLNQRVLKVDVLDANLLDPGFVYYWLQPYISKVNDETAATTVKHLSVKDLYRASARIPQAELQRKIAAILTSLDTAIEKTEALIAKLQQVKAGLMHDLFTRGVLPDGKFRPRRDVAPESYKATHIGWLPEEWSVKTMLELAAEESGSTTIGPFGSDLMARDYQTEGVPVAFVRDIKASGFAWKSNVYLTPKKARDLIAHCVKPGDILATKMGLPPCLACVYPSWMPAGVITADLIRLTPNTERVNSDWLAAAINHDRVMRQVAAITAGVTRPKVTLSDFRRLKVAAPSLAEQTRIAALLASAQRPLEVNQNRVAKLLVQKAGLMQKLLHAPQATLERMSA